MVVNEVRSVRHIENWYIGGMECTFATYMWRPNRNCVRTRKAAAPAVAVAVANQSIHSFIHTFVRCDTHKSSDALQHKKKRSYVWACECVLSEFRPLVLYYRWRVFVGTDARADAGAAICIRATGVCHSTFSVQSIFCISVSLFPLPPRLPSRLVLGTSSLWIAAVHDSMRFLLFCMFWQHTKHTSLLHHPCYHQSVDFCWLPTMVTI